MGEHVSRASVAAVRAHVCHAHAVGVDYLFTLLVNIHACVCLLLSCDCARHAWMRGKQQAATLVSIINQSTTLVFYHKPICDTRFYHKPICYYRSGRVASKGRQQPTFKGKDRRPTWLLLLPSAQGFFRQTSSAGQLVSGPAHADRAACQ